MASGRRPYADAQAWADTLVDALADPRNATVAAELSKLLGQARRGSHSAGVRASEILSALNGRPGAVQYAGGENPKPKPPPTTSTRGRRHADKSKGTTTEDAVFAAVADALAEGVDSLGRSREVHRAAMGYGLWRESHPEAPSVARIKQLFGPKRTKRDADTWAAVVRLGRKSGHIPPK